MSAKMRGSVTLVAKTCHGCDQLKMAEEFSADRARAMGHKARCKTCELPRVQAYQKRNPQQLRTYNRAVQRALRQLRDAHREEYEMWLRIELDGDEGNVQ